MNRIPESVLSLDENHAAGAQRAEPPGERSPVGGPGRSTPEVRLHPKEHGAYAIIAVPLVTAYCLAGLTLEGVLVGVAAAAAFWAHEPMLVAIGHRGRRAQQAASVALRLLIVLGSVSFLAGVTALFLGSPIVRWSLLGVLLLGASNIGLSIAGWHRSAVGQWWGTVGLSAPCVPILLAGGIDPWSALAVWCTLIVGFTATTFAVRGVIARQKRRPRHAHAATIVAASAACGSLLALGQWWISASLPMLIASWALLLFPPSARHLRRVGWTLVVATVLTAVAIVVIFRFYPPW